MWDEQHPLNWSQEKLWRWIKDRAAKRGLVNFSRADGELSEYFSSKGKRISGKYFFSLNIKSLQALLPGASGAIIYDLNTWCIKAYDVYFKFNLDMAKWSQKEISDWVKINSSEKIPDISHYQLSLARKLNATTKGFIINAFRKNTSARSNRNVASILEKLGRFFEKRPDLSHIAYAFYSRLIVLRCLNEKIGASRLESLSIYAKNSKKLLKIPSKFVSNTFKYFLDLSEWYGDDLINLIRKDDYDVATSFSEAMLEEVIFNIKQIAVRVIFAKKNMHIRERMINNFCGAIKVPLDIRKLVLRYIMLPGDEIYNNVQTSSELAAALCLKTLKSRKNEFLSKEYIMEKILDGKVEQTLTAMHNLTHIALSQYIKAITQTEYYKQALISRLRKNCRQKFSDWQQALELIYSGSFNKMFLQNLGLIRKLGSKLDKFGIKISPHKLLRIYEQGRLLITMSDEIWEKQLPVCENELKRQFLYKATNEQLLTSIADSNLPINRKQTLFLSVSENGWSGKYFLELISKDSKNEVLSSLTKYSLG